MSEVINYYDECIRRDREPALIVGREAVRMWFDAKERAAQTPPPAPPRVSDPDLDRVLIATIINAMSRTQKSRVRIGLETIARGRGSLSAAAADALDRLGSIL